MTKVLAISAHPDDETLGCGGTLLRHGANGDELHWVIATTGFEPRWSKSVLAEKTREIEAVANAYGMASVQRLGFPATRLSMMEESDVIDKVAEAIAKVRPEHVYTVHGGDVHSDHRVLFQAVAAVLKPFYMRQHGVRRFLAFETLSSTEAASNLGSGFMPTVVNDISDWVERKLEIMTLFASELHEEPMPRSESAIRALARFRGATIATDHAEAFQLIREIT